MKLPRSSRRCTRWRECARGAAITFKFRLLALFVWLDDSSAVAEGGVNYTEFHLSAVAFEARNVVRCWGEPEQVRCGAESFPFRERAAGAPNLVKACSWEVSEKWWRRTERLRNDRDVGFLVLADCWTRKKKSVINCQSISQLFLMCFKEVWNKLQPRTYLY